MSESLIQQQILATACVPVYYGVTMDRISVVAVWFRDAFLSPFIYLKSAYDGRILQVYKSLPNKNRAV